MKPMPSAPFAGFPHEYSPDGLGKGPRPGADPSGSARTERRLSDIAIGCAVSIRSARDEAARRRLSLYGLIEGVEVVVEKRGNTGDLIVRFEAARYYIPAHLAHAIWVSPGIGSDAPERDR